MEDDVRYARYEERASGGEAVELPGGLVVRHGAPSDRDALAALVFEREGGVWEEHLRGAEKELSGERQDNLLLVAAVQGGVVGFARARYFAHPPDPPANVAPEGWYLAGVIVSPGFRRRGVAAELTRRRLRWISERAREAFYFVNVLNRASIDLHERFGFEEVTRDFSFPGVAFQGERGILYRVDLGEMARQAGPRLDSQGLPDA